MSKNPNIKKVVIIGSGPIIIGQAAEFDYAGTQACRAIREEGVEVVLINSNPATIMTDKQIADKVYIEPLTVETIKKVIIKEKPDSILPTLGGQNALNLAVELEESGFLKEHNVTMIGTSADTIRMAEDRELFKEAMERIHQPCAESEIAEDLDRALQVAERIGYPVVVRPAYTLGGSGGGIAYDREQLISIASLGLHRSRVHQVLIERCISGWKEIEYEVMRDKNGNCITVCNMENFDPVGVHTGDSIVVAPCQTLADKETQMLRSAALDIITELGVEGGCNVQFALNPNSFEYCVIEVNPRVSRSSALASKATGYPIAKVASKIALGYTLDEIPNAITKKTYACFEPTLDYCVVKIPKWPFDKFQNAKRLLGTQMKATGEVMSIGTNFELAFMKAIRSIELGLDTPNLPKLVGLSKEELHDMISHCDDERIFVIYQAMKKGVTADEVYDITKIDRWFLSKLKKIATMEAELASGVLDEEKYMQAKRMGFLDKTIERISGQKPPIARDAAYKMVDTCAGEFDAQTPYFYSTWDDENEAALHIQENPTDKKTILVFGSGPIRIGQGIEFDYCSVHCVHTLKELGYEAIIANNNPETVSTDFDTSDRLYFDPLTPEDVRSVVKTENPYACVVQFGGQTAIKLSQHLNEMGLQILGTPVDSIDKAEDKERFDEMLEKLGIPRPKGETVFTTEEALESANRLGYPVLLRPSYVLGGQNMIIAYNDADVTEYMAIITSHEIENPVLIDKYMMGTEVEVDAICDGEDYLIPGIMEHIERAGIHSGDSISVYPPQTIPEKHKKTIIEYTAAMARELKIVGLINVQYVIYNDQVYVIEANPRSSRTVPYISKVTGVPMVDLATRCMLGSKLKDLGYGTGLYPEGEYVSVKVPVFSFEKLKDVDVALGPEMKSTGEVLGIDKSFQNALLKGLTAAGYKLKKKGGVFISVRDSDKQETIRIADRFANLGFDIYATSGTASVLNHNMIAASSVHKLSEEAPNVADLLESGKVDYVISTSAKGRLPALDSVKLRRMSIEHAIPCLTALDTANALLSCLEMDHTIDEVSLVDITEI